MRYLTVREVVEATGGTWLGDEAGLLAQVRGMDTDSRRVTEGAGFVAVKGERVDGHRFIGAVLSVGASCVIADRSCEAAIWTDIKEYYRDKREENRQDNCQDKLEYNCQHNCQEKAGVAPIILVDDTLEALRRVAARYREGFDIPVVAVIGSVGKTSTKEYVAGVLSKGFNVLKTQGNYNNDIGLPLTLMSVRPDHTMAVVEMGINHFGEMRLLSSIAKPDMVVFTNVAPCHLEYLGDLWGVLRAKSEVFEYMEESAPCVINGDDPYLITIKDSGRKGVIACGAGRDLEVSGSSGSALGSSIRVTGRLQSRDLTDRELEIEAVVRQPGAHMIKNALMAAAVGAWFGMEESDIADGIESVLPVEGRNRVIDRGSFTVIDDCYNANPASMKAAIEMLSSFNERRIAVLGDMGELGEDAKLYHREIGKLAGRSGVDYLYCTGELSREMIEGFEEAQDYGEKRGFYFHNIDDMTEALLQMAKEKCVILVKASHSMGFSRVVERLCKAE